MPLSSSAPQLRKQFEDTALDFVRLGYGNGWFSEEVKKRIEEKLREKGAKTTKEMDGDTPQTPNHRSPLLIPTLLPMSKA